MVRPEQGQRCYTVTLAIRPVGRDTETPKPATIKKKILMCPDCVGNRDCGIDLLKLILLKG
jgi:hypothetical protein